MPRVGPTLMQRLHQEFGDLETAWMMSGAQLSRVEGFGPKLVSGIAAARPQIDPQTLLDQYQQLNPRFLTPGDLHYPALLQQLPAPPPLLNYCGQIDPAEMRGERFAVAIVGTRSPSEYGRRWTRRLARALAQAGFTIVSGLADGIDAEAHHACLEAGGRTVAVLGTGVDVVYPARNRGLYREILKQGLILSEYSAGTPPDRTHFPQRNRIVAGFCRAVIVVEAPERSGALITANLANEFCRDVYVVPGTLDNPNARGCLALIAQGAQVILDEAHLLTMLGAMPVLDGAVSASNPAIEPANKPTAIPSLSLVRHASVAIAARVSPILPPVPPELEPIFAAVEPEACSFDRIVQYAQMPTGDVSSGLLQLELLGLIVELPGKQYQRIA